MDAADRWAHTGLGKGKTRFWGDGRQLGSIPHLAAPALMSAVTRRVGFPGSDRPAGQGLALACLTAAVARGDDSAVFRGAAEKGGGTAVCSLLALLLPYTL